MKFFNNLNLLDNQAQSLVLDQQASVPGSPAVGQLWYNTTVGYAQIQLAARTMTITDQYVTGVTGTGVINVTAGLAPVVSLNSSTTSGQALLSSGATGTSPVYGALNLAGGASIVTGILPVANGGVGVATGAANLIFATPSGATGAPGLRALVSADLPSAPTFGGIVTASSFTGAGTGLTGTAASLSIGGVAATATSLASGSANQIPYQTAAGVTSFFSAANYGVQIYGSTGVPLALAGAAGVLVGSASANPIFSTTPALTGTNFSAIPNTALTNSSVTIGSTNIALGATATTITGITSLTATTLVGALTGNASSATVASTQTIAATSTNASFYPTVVSAATGSLAEYTVASFTINPSTGAITGTSFNLITGLGSATPAMDGVGAVGVSTLASRSDHVHPSDTSRIATSQLGIANGVATLDGSGKLTTAQIPAALVGSVVYQGVWNASTNSPALSSGTGTKGQYYKVSVAGTTAIDGISSWNIGDTIIFDGTTWDKIDGQAIEVVSVFGRNGAVVATTGDYTVSQITGAAPLASPALTGVPTAPTATPGTNTTQLATTAFVLGQGFLSVNQTITLSGDVTGSGNTAITTTLAASGVTAGSYAKVTVNAKGLVTAGLALTNADLPTSGVVAGTYPKVTVNAQGIVTGGASLLASDIPTIAFTQVSGTVPISQGGTGQTTAAAALAALGGVTKATGLIGNGSLTTVPFVHNLNLANKNAFIHAVVIEATGEVVMPDCFAVDANTINLIYGPGNAPGVNAHRVSVVG